MSVIRYIEALEILDSRGRPTIACTCVLESGAIGSASVPSGASTGKAEALELRDRDPQRYDGWGCRTAVDHVVGPIQQHVAGRHFSSQAELDQALVQLDGTHNKSRLGANAILAVSLSFARAAAVEQGIALYEYLARLVPQIQPRQLPRLTINLFSGGKHAGGQVSVQDVLVVPAAATIGECLEHAFAVYQEAVRLTESKYGARALVADEGGLAPPFADSSSMFTDALQAIRRAGLEPGRDMFLAVDVAASHFWTDGRYVLDGRELTSNQMIETLVWWCDDFPLVSVEDGLAEDDWDHWPRLRAGLPPRVRVMGDDLLCTNPARMERAITARAADALLLKVNQIGTLTEAADACRLAHEAGWEVTVSARSGETEDCWLADLAVAWGESIKVGSITRSERLAKYNRLLAIEATKRKAAF